MIDPSQAEHRVSVHLLDHFARRERQCRNARCRLCFAANVSEPASPCGACGESVYRAPTFAIRSSKIVELSLAKCVAVGERRTRNVFRARIDRLDSKRRRGTFIRSVHVFLKFTLQFVKQSRTFAALVDIDVIQAFVHQANALVASPRPQACESTIDKTQPCQTIERVVNPTV